MEPADVFFWKYLELLLRSLMLCVWGWGVLYTLAKIGRYRNMIWGVLGCFGMLLFTAGDLLQRLPYSLVLTFDYFEAARCHSGSAMFYLMQNYYWEGIQGLMQIFLVMALAGRIKFVAREPIAETESPEPSKSKRIEEKGPDPYAETYLPVAGAVLPPARGEGSIKDEETLCDYRVIKEFQERESEEDFTLSIPDGKEKIMRQLESEEDLLQSTEGQPIPFRIDIGPVVPDSERGEESDENDYEREKEAPAEEGTEAEEDEFAGAKSEDGEPDFSPDLPGVEDAESAAMEAEHAESDFSPDFEDEESEFSGVKSENARPDLNLPEEEDEDEESEFSGVKSENARPDLNLHGYKGAGSDEFASEESETPAESEEPFEQLISRKFGDNKGDGLSRYGESSPEASEISDDFDDDDYDDVVSKELGDLHELDLEEGEKDHDDVAPGEMKRDSGAKGIRPFFEAKSAKPFFEDEREEEPKRPGRGKSVPAPDFEDETKGSTEKYSGQIEAAKKPAKLTKPPRLLKAPKLAKTTPDEKERDPLSFLRGAAGSANVKPASFLKKKFAKPKNSEEDED